MLRLSILTISFSFFCSLDATADESAGGASSIDEIVVTAARREVRFRELSSPLTLIDADSILGEKLVTDALSEKVGVFVQQTTPGQGAPIVRGLKGSGLLHLVDGMRLNNAIFRSAPTQYFSLVPASAVRHIEVIRGTPTSLYGSDAVGGVIQLVTRVPAFDSLQTQFRGDAYASFDSAELSKVFRATVDAGTRSLAGSVSAEYLTMGDRRTGSGNRIGPSNYTSKAARVVLAGSPDDRRSWVLDLHALEQPDTPRVDELVAGFGQSEPSSSEFSFAPNRRLFAHARFNQDRGWLQLDWRVDLAWQRIDDDRISRDYQALDRRFESNASDLYGATVSGSRQTKAGSWIVGAEYYYDRVASSRSEENLLTGQTQLLQSRFPDGSSINQGALFANMLQRISARQLLNGGLRISTETVDLPATATTSTVSIDVSDVSGDIGWVFDTTARSQFVANAGFGFRAPNVFDVGTLGARPGNRFNIPNSDLQSEHVLQADIGYRWQSGRVQLELTVFALDYDDRIVSVSTGDVTAEGRDIVQSRNAAGASIYGAEGGAVVRISDNWSVRSVVNYTRGEQKFDSEQAEPSDRIPPLSGLLSIDYDAGKRFRAAAWLRFAGAQNRLSARDVRDVRIDPQGTAGWGSLGGELYWDFDSGLSVTVGIDNALDKQYRVHGSGLDAAGRNLSASIRRVW